jgi:hypothetical protein
MLLHQNKKLRFLSFLKTGLNPFQKFVSTGEIKEEIGLVRSRSELINSIKDVIDSSENFILPIIGEIGTGKTHLYWALKKKLYYYNTIYISLDTVYRKFFYNVYSEFIEEIGPEVLRSITSSLCNNWGALDRKFGFFHVADIEKVKKTAFDTLSQNPSFSDQIALNDVLTAITAHQLHPYKKIEAERWLLGELMDFRELSHLNLLYDLKRRAYAFTIFKIISEHAKLGTVLFIDDFERIISLMKPQKSEVIFEPGWLYDDETKSPDEVAAEKILDKILQFNNIQRLRIIITLKSVDSLEEIKRKVKEANEEAIFDFLKDPLFLENFEDTDIFEFYRKNIESFLVNINFSDFLEEFWNSYYPLNEEILKKINRITHGNPREIIKQLISLFNDIIYSDEELDVILNKILEPD